MSNKAYIVWNEAKNEGVIFVDDGTESFFGTAEDDAEHAAHGDGFRNGSSIANAFVESYEEDVRTIQVVDTSIFFS